MKFLKTVIIFSIGFLVSNCGFSKENNVDFLKKIIKILKVIRRTFLMILLQKIKF